MPLIPFSQRARSLLPVASVTVGATLALRRLDDFDTWWHLASGRWIVNHRAVPDTDTLSYTVPDHDWINLQWLYDVVLYLLHCIGGADLLVLASAAAFTAALWILMKNLRLWLGDVSASLLLLWAVLIAEERFLIRPEMISFVLLQAILWILMTARRNDGRHLWLLAPLMLLWVNSHALFIVGLYCMGCIVAGVLAAKIPFLPPGWRQASALGPVATRRLLVSTAAATAVTFLNPYLADGVFFPLKLMSRIDTSNSAFQAIGEFRRPFSGYFTTLSIGAYQLLFFFSLAVVTVAAVCGFRAPKNPGASVDVRTPGFNAGWAAMFVGFAYLSVLARRNIGLFAFGAIPIVGAWLTLIESRVPEVLRRAIHRASTVSAPALLAGYLALAGIVVTNTYYRWDGTVREFGLGTLEVNFPIRAAAFARATALPPKLYNDLTAGGYLAWDRAVEGGVFVDGRLEVYDTAFFSSYLSGLSDLRLWRQQIQAYDIDTVLLFHRWSNRHALIRFLLSDPAWALVYHDEVAVIFVRTQGNETTIQKAREIYPTWHTQVLTTLRTPTSRWQWPVGRLTALNSYADLLFLIGETESAIEIYEQLLSLKPPAWQELAAHVAIGFCLAQTGDRDRALKHLRKAAELDPYNQRLQEVIQRLGQ